MIVFGILAVALVVAALMVVHTNKITYAALCLAASLGVVASLFLTLSAEFLAVVQLLVYAGAVVTLILFAIMFANREIEEEES
ncbi:MAG: NADH-quinone oxidoreductase subunit J [Candidatus Bipolaricaulia bacterium]